MILFSLSLCLLGFVLIALNMPKHYEQIRQRKGQWHKISLWLGYAILFAALYPCYLELGVSIGIVLWLTLLTFASLIVMFFLSYKGKIIIPLTLVSLLLSTGLLAQQSLLA